VQGIHTRSEELISLGSLQGRSGEGRVSGFPTELVVPDVKAQSQLERESDGY
jgi:hypothetical protein